LPAGVDLGAAADLVVGPIMTRIYFTGEPVRARDIRSFVEAALFGICRLRTGTSVRPRRHRGRKS
jgi:hypothetical protein